MTNSNKPNMDNEPQQPSNNPPPEDDSDVWLEDRKAYPGEKLYGGRGVIFLSQMLSGASRSPLASKPDLEQKEYKLKMMKGFDEKLRKEVEAQFNSGQKFR